MNKLSSMDFWRMHDHLSIFQAVMLILGHDPSIYTSWEIQRDIESSRPSGFSALLNFLHTAAIKDKIACDKKFIMYPDDTPDFSQLDIDKTIIEVESLKHYLSSKGINTGFFFSGRADSRPYLDKKHPSYAPKLAAAVRAWESVSSNLSDYKGKSPKQALDIWLRKNANEFGLLNEEGNPINQSIEEISKISNWKTSGGATKTPSNENPPTPETTGNDIDTDFPF